MKMSNMKKQQGFTLIELVVVIVILGILAVTAAPKFINLQDDAKTATLQAVKASMQSASSLVYSKALIAGRETSTGAESVLVNGVDVFVRYGYPRDNNDAALDNWTDDLLDLNPDEFTVSRQNNGIVIFHTGTVLSGAWPNPIDEPDVAAGERNCFVQYRESDVSGDAPLIIEVSPCL